MYSPDWKIVQVCHASSPGKVGLLDDGRWVDLDAVVPDSVESSVLLKSIHGDVMALITQTGPHDTDQRASFLEEGNRDSAHEYTPDTLNKGLSEMGFPPIPDIDAIIGRLKKLRRGAADVGVEKLQ